MKAFDNIEAQDIGKSAAIKITLPETLSNDLAAYAESKGTTKSEVVKFSLLSLLSNDQIWQRKLYFFKRREPKILKNEVMTVLSTAPKGTLIKIAANHIDNPTSASIWICNLIKVSEEKVFIDIPQIYRNSTLQESLLIDHQDVSLSNGNLNIPTEQVINNFGWNQNQYIYEIDSDYIWDVDTNTQLTYNTSPI